MWRLVLTPAPLALHFIKPKVFKFKVFTYKVTKNHHLNYKKHKLFCLTVIAWISCCPADVQFPAVTLNLSVQHLTTFVLDRKDGMITVDDGIRRLRLLDAKGKVWTQEMLLQVEEKMVSLIDLGTKVRLKTRIYFWFCFLWGVVCLF